MLRSDPVRTRGEWRPWWSDWATKGVQVWVSYVLILAVASKVQAVDEVAVLGRLEELLLLLVLPAALVGAIALWRRSWHGKAFFLGLAAYLLAGMASWMGSGIGPGPLALQALLELKFPVVLSAFLGLGILGGDAIRRLVPPVKGVLLASLLLVLFHVALPDAYAEVFPTSADVGRFRLPGGGSLARATGAFGHPSSFAYVSGLTGGYFLLRFIVTRSRRAGLWFALCGVLTITSLQRQELLALLTFPFVIAFLMRRHRSWSEKLTLGSTGVAVGLLGLTLLVPLLLPYLKFMVRNLGIVGTEEITTARTVFYVFGLRLAAIHFPLGVGLGAYGGYAAQFFDSPVYRRLGFGSFEWYRADRFMTDTFWPHVLGESGWLGFLFYAGAMAALVLLAVREIRRSKALSGPGPPLYAAAALYGLLFLLSGSITSAVLTSALPLALGLMWFSMLPVNDLPSGARSVQKEM